MVSRGVLVVTGGGRGIGAATSRLAAASGYSVVVNYADNVGPAEALVAAIRADGGAAIAVRGDVSVSDDVEHIFAAADRIGPLAGLVNNAGVINPKGRVDEMDAARIGRLFAVNVTGTLLCSKAAILRMSSRHGGKGGAIVNVSSGAAKLGAPAAYIDYAASKGAVDTLTVGMALELAEEGIRVNAVRPGLIDTEFHAMGGEPDRLKRVRDIVPVKRAGTVDEVALAILWLLSPDASYTTGAILPVSGGRGILP